MLGKAGWAQSVRDEVLIYEPLQPESEIGERLENYTQRIDGHEVIDSKVRIQDHLSAIGAPYVELQYYSSSQEELMQLEHFGNAAMSAARSAIEYGFVPGGCVRFIEVAGIMERLSEEPLGQAFKNVLLSPFQEMNANRLTFRIESRS